MPPTFPFHVAPQLLVQVPLLLFQVQFLHPVEGGDRMGTAVPCPGAWLGPGSRAVTTPVTHVIMSSASSATRLFFF